MKNITVSVPDEVYHAARVKAAEMRTSVSAIVRVELEKLASSKPPRNEAMAKFFEEYDRAHKHGPGFSASSRLTREELYDTARRGAGDDDGVR
ncbi:MAG: hypothetical protein ABI811_05335 [Acidobacteriota bacterium]